MFTRHLIAAAALMAATFSAQADVISTSPDALASSSVIANATVASGSTLAANMNIVDGGTSLNGAGTGLASILASSNNTAQLYLVRGVEGLYMLAARLIDTAPAAGTTPAATSPLLVDGTPAQVAPVPAAGIDTPVANADPILLPAVEAAEVPEPSSIALLLAGVLGAAGFTRARKQG